MQFVDTHCHIHEETYPDAYLACSRAIEAGVTMMFCVGTDENSSRRALEFCHRYAFCRAIVGVHPHESSQSTAYIEQILKDKHESVMGVGEIGLDYYYNHAPREVQIQALEQQLQWARDYQLPVSFHVREASSVERRESVWSDFWPILANFPGTRGVLHSYTDNAKNLDIALGKDLYIGVNGISTFAKDKQAMWDAIPLEKMLLETDAPFLTPVPHRGTVNEPAFVRNVAEYHAGRRQITLEHLARVTSANAHALFNAL